MNLSAMKKILFFSILTAIFFPAQSQLTKNNWLVGGTGKLYSYTSTYNSVEVNKTSRHTQIDASSNIGYFVIDKLALGLRPTFTSIKGKVSNREGSTLTTNVQRYWLGPFARFYFLDPEKQFNILTDIGYQFGILNAGGMHEKLSTFSALAGPVIFINSSLGLEVLIGYSSNMENGEYKKGIQIGLGLQIHLEK